MSRASAPRAAARWYRGDCHLHSVRSTGGELAPAQLTAAARAAGLDFVAVTEHNTTDGYADWVDRTGDLLVICGQEVVTRTGHWLALGLPPGHLVDWRYGNDNSDGDDRIGRQLDEVHRAGGLCVVAHPYAPYPSGTFEYPYQGFDAVEVWNGQWASDLPWNADNEAALADWAASLVDWAHRPAAGVGAGGWRPVIGNSDTHLAGQIGVPHTVVRAAGRTVDALLAGIAAGHSWIAGSTDVDLSVIVSAGDRRADIGERLDTGGATATVEVEVRGVPSGTVSAHTDRGTAYRVVLSADGAGSLRWRTDATASAFVRVEVRHPDGRLAALSNPVTLV
ncbi:CehA/McbA family metallohydrolase [Solwaraspora sp. WMMD937]|uniref:CehA/McbA family metallohydrolase n=1 Tax=Solwaraspora sp. WMMD937 TaxID=3016090 RepID=UPI00249A2AB8|nr:CehA/McbA family metallohydrolase [Solwaraspora sp. WMMD937]WFE21493.1 CehA/McbA family metallohydrolase [Solwaraspora sp. WMMD937]